MAVPLVGEADVVPNPIQQRMGLEMRDVDDDPAAGLENALQLSDEAAIIGDVLQKIHDDDLVERAGGEGGSASVQLIYVVSHQRPDRRHRARVQVATVPAPAALAQQVADDPIVRADVQARLPSRVPQQLQDPAVLRLLEHRPVEQCNRPACLRRVRQSHFRG